MGLKVATGGRLRPRAPIPPGPGIWIRKAGSDFRAAARCRAKV